MTSVVIGGAGFIGRRLIPRLVERGEDVVCMDINPDTAAFGAEGGRVKVVRSDVTQFDDVIVLLAETRPERLINLSYYIGSDLPPRVATKLNVVGMDNCFEAARLSGFGSCSGSGPVEARRAVPRLRRDRAGVRNHDGQDLTAPGLGPPVGPQRAVVRRIGIDLLALDDGPQARPDLGRQVGGSADATTG